MLVQHLQDRPDQKSGVSTPFLYICIFKEEVSALLKKILTGKNNPNKDEDARAVSLYGTSRLTTPSSPANKASAICHEALDLHGSQPYNKKPAHRKGSREEADLLKRYKKKKALSSEGASSSTKIQDDWIGNHPIKNDQKQQGRGLVDLFNQYYESRAEPPIQSGESALDLYQCHRVLNLSDSNKPINMPKEKKKPKRGLNLNENACHNSREMQAYYNFIKGPMIQAPYSPPGQGSVDLFNEHYGQRAPLPDESAKMALDLHESAQNCPVPDLNIPVNTRMEMRTRKSEK